MNICIIPDFSQDDLKFFFSKCLKYQNINYDIDAINYITSKAYVNTYTLISLIPKIGNQTQKIPPKTSVRDSKVRSAAGNFLEPIE